MGPERIAHGPGAADDPDLCAELMAREYHLPVTAETRDAKTGTLIGVQSLAGTVLALTRFPAS